MAQVVSCFTSSDFTFLLPLGLNCSLSSWEACSAAKKINIFYKWVRGGGCAVMGAVEARGGAETINRKVLGRSLSG
jgi:hypothetical protein